MALPLSQGPVSAVPAWKASAAESPETAVAEEKENEAGAENIVADASEEKPDQSGEDQQV